MALLADFGASLFDEGKASVDLSVLLAPLDVAFTAHSIVLEHRSPVFAAKIGDARRNQARTGDGKGARGRLSIRVEHPFEVSLDTFNAFLRFLYTGNLDHLSPSASHSVSSLMLLVQWYKLKLVQKEHSAPTGGYSQVMPHGTAPGSYSGARGRSSGDAYAAESREMQRLKAELQQEREQMKAQMQQQKRQQEQQQRQLQLQRNEMEIQQRKHQEQLQRQMQREQELTRQHHTQQQYQQLQQQFQQPRMQPGLLGSGPNDRINMQMQNLRIGERPRNANHNANNNTSNNYFANVVPNGGGARKKDDKGRAPTQEQPKITTIAKKDKTTTKEAAKKVAEGKSMTPDESLGKNLEIKVTNIPQAVSFVEFPFRCAAVGEIHVAPFTQLFSSV